MKKLKSSLCILLLLTGCAGAPATQPSATPAPAETSESTPEASFGMPLWGASEYGFTETDEKTGEEIMTARYVLPRITNEPAAPGWTAVNEYYTAEGETLQQQGRQTADSAREDYDYFKESGYDFYTYDDEESYELRLDTETIASILRIHYSFTGAHGNVMYRSDTFDMETGGRLTLDDVFTVPASDYLPRLMTEIKALADAQYKMNEGDTLIEESALEDSFDPECFYLTDDALVIYYQTYTLGCYAMEAPEFSIPQETMEDILITW